MLAVAERELDGDACAVLLAVAHGEPKRLPELIAALSDGQRRSCVPHLKAWRARLRNEWDRWFRPRRRALVIAGAGCHTGAAAAAGWLAHDDLGMLEPSDAAGLMTVLGGRPAQWLGDVARRLADRIRPGDAWDWPRYALVERLVALSGCPMPTGDGVVLGWALERTWPQRSARWSAAIGAIGTVGGAPEPHRRLPPGGTLAERLRDDLFLDTLLPRLFEVEGAGAVLEGWDTVQETEGPSWPKALAALAAEGRLERSALLDGCLSRLLRGGRPAELRGFLSVLKGLAPTDDEYAARATTLLRLLPDAPSTVAAHAQERLAALDADGRLDDERLAQASRAVLFRTEKKLVRAQLSWLDGAARRDRERAGAVVLAAADAFGHEDTALQERALNLIARHLKYAGDAVRTELARAAQALSPVLRPRAAGLLGVELPDDGVADRWEDVLPPVPGPAPMAPPLATATEVAEEVGAVLAAARAAQFRPSAASGADAAVFERALDGLVRHAHRDRDGLVRALEPVIRDHPLNTQNGWWGDPRQGHIRYLAAVLCGEDSPPPPSAADAQTLWYPRGRDFTPFGEVLGARLLEAAWRVLNDPPPFLLATPTTADGRIDPAELVARLAEYGRTGAVPGSCDLDQALLRLDVSAAGPDVLAAAGRLGGEAGRRVRVWLEAGGPSLPEPVRDARPTYRVHGYGSPVVRVRLSREAAALPCPLGPAFQRLLGRYIADGKRDETPWTGSARLWPSVLPVHRELVALHLQPTFAATGDEDLRGGAARLPELAEAGGEAGEAVHLGLAHTLGARHPEDRTAAVDALLVLAARGDLDAARLGRDVAETVAAGTVKPNRLLESLREAVRAGAPATVFAVLAAALPGMLAAPDPVRGPVRGLPDLLALAAECAGTCGARGPVGGVAQAADRGGSGRLVKEARRLRDVLGAPVTA
ncbi:DUF6493 family protein [Streptomyces barkulensis]|uniref:DUF6493 family protein n=1 Tax=Streptomyces barkulensis TaxID=1257026 RepID=UPI00117C682F|nr:DUF6493 family protein [Streptomyces barkulensis]